MIIEKRWRWGLCLAMASSLVAIGPEESLASLTVRHWGAQAGIPEETVSALLASGDGYVWLATNHGLARFDGSRAQVFRLGDMFRPKGTGSCSSNSLNALLAGKKGQIWVGAGSGCVFQIRRDRFGGFASFEVMAMESPTVGRQDSAVQLLLESSDGELVEVIRQSGEDLVSIVDDILCLAKVEAGKIRLERAPVELYGLGESLLALFQAKADAKGVGMRLVVEPGVPRLILSDPQRMRQILLNLVGNAIKFTERGEVRLRVSADASLITFHVEDTGMGISPAALLTLFEPFVQADSSTTRRFGGSGLGLSIVRRLVEAMGGRVSVESEVAVGSVFRVTLPLEAWRNVSRRSRWRWWHTPKAWRNWACGYCW